MGVSTEIFFSSVRCIVTSENFEGRWESDELSYNILPDGKPALFVARIIIFQLSTRLKTTRLVSWPWLLSLLWSSSAFASTCRPTSPLPTKKQRATKQTTRILFTALNRTSRKAKHYLLTSPVPHLSFFSWCILSEFFYWLRIFLKTGKFNFLGTRFFSSEGKYEL